MDLFWAPVPATSVLLPTPPFYRPRVTKTRPRVDFLLYFTAGDREGRCGACVEARGRGGCPPIRVSQVKTRLWRSAPRTKVGIDAALAFVASENVSQRNRSRHHDDSFPRLAPYLGAISGVTNQRITSIQSLELTRPPLERVCTGTGEIAYLRRTCREVRW